MNRLLIFCLMGVGTIAPASAATSIPHDILCKTDESTGPAREFVVRFNESKGKLKLLALTEKQRIFTPGNAVASWSTANGGTMIRIPDQRPGKWGGKVTPVGYDFALKAADGTAAFSLVASNGLGRNYELNWSAIVISRFGNEQRAEGVGRCHEQGSVQ